MNTYGFSFGHNHVDRFGNSLGSKFVLIKANNSGEARNIMWQNRHSSWSFQYDKEKIDQLAEKHGWSAVPLSQVSLLIIRSGKKGFYQLLNESGRIVMIGESIVNSKGKEHTIVEAFAPLEPSSEIPSLSEGTIQISKIGLHRPSEFGLQWQYIGSVNPIQSLDVKGRDHD